MRVNMLGGRADRQMGRRTDTGEHAGQTSGRERARWAD